MTAPLPMRIRFDRHWKADDPSACWLWQGCALKSGYGVFRTGGAGSLRTTAHRVAWTIHRGPIPRGLMVLHRCDNPPCVNPDHLFLGTHDDNMRDMRAKGRQLWGERSHWSKLSHEDVALIRSSDESSRALAPRLGVDDSTIRYARRKATWRGARP